MPASGADDANQRFWGVRTADENELHHLYAHYLFGTVIRDRRSGTGVAAISVVIAATIVLGFLIAMLGLVPLMISDARSVEYHFTAQLQSGAALPSFEDFTADGVSFACDSVIAASEEGLQKVTCRSVDIDGGGFARLLAELEDRGLGVVVDNIEMTSSSAVEWWAVLVVSVAYIALAFALIRGTVCGWGVRALRSLGWKALLLALAPLALTFGAGAIAGMAFPAGALSTPSGDREAMFPDMGAGPALFLLLPVLAALPEEALFRGWLHEKLFDRMPTWLAYLVVAELFVLVHAGLIAAIFSHGAESTLAIFQVIAVFFLSLLLTYIRRLGGSVALCVIAHAVYNAAVIALSLAAASGK